MTVTTTGLTKAAGVAAAAAGAVFIAVQLGHPQLDLTTITTTNVFVRDVGKVLMCVLALAGITGMYLSQVRRNGIFGLVGYLVFAANYLSIMCTTYIAAFVLPTLADSNPGYVKDVIALSTSHGTVTGDLGALAFSWGKVQAVLYLSGGLLFGIALFRAHVLARWACVLLAVSGFASVVLTLMPDAFYRLLAFPNAIALIGLGVSLWRSQRTASTETSTAGTSASPAGVPAARVAPSTVR
jgi:hypothetical protein